MNVIIFRKHDLIDDTIAASVFTHHTGEIGLHLDSKSGGVSTIFMLDKTDSARALAAMLNEAADAVDPKPSAQEDGANG